MHFPDASPEQIDFFRQHGWLVVKDAIPQADLDELEAQCEVLIAKKDKLANDWAWSDKEDLKDRSFRIIQSSPSFVWKEIKEQPYRQWLIRFGNALMGMELSYWYDQFLAKPPGKSVPTYWHQDEAYWGRNLDDKGVTGWIPLQDVDAANGCMHFIDRGHLDGVSAAPHGRGHGERPHHLRRRREPHGGLPDQPRRRDVPSLEDAAHDDRQHLEGLAQGGDQPHAAGRRRRRGRPLSVEDHRQPAHRRAHRPPSRELERGG